VKAPFLKIPICSLVGVRTSSATTFHI
jgi:hypothetical protein